MTFSEILNILLGGGLIALVIGVITLKATVRKANADAEKAKAEAEAVNLTNTENATRILVENIVKPLKEELNATRKDLQATKREMARLRKAVESDTNCPNSDYCPVLFKLRDNQKETEGVAGTEGEHREIRFDNHYYKAEGSGDSTDERSGNVDTYRQPS